MAGCVRLREGRISYTFSIVPAALGKASVRQTNLVGLLDGYFHHEERIEGGQHLNVNVMNREMLLDAIAHPENYPNLTHPRLWLCGALNALTHEQQQDVISRTFTSAVTQRGDDHGRPIFRVLWAKPVHCTVNRGVNMISASIFSKLVLALRAPYGGADECRKSFITELATRGNLTQTTRIVVDLYGSLSLTGKGHATDAHHHGAGRNSPQDVDIDAIPAFIQR